MTQIWVVTPYGQNTSNVAYKTKDAAFNSIWSYDLLNKTIAIGSSLVGNPEGKTMEELLKAISEAQQDRPPRSLKMKAEQLWKYYSEVKEGDFIIAKTGLNKVLGIGRVFKREGKVAFYSVEKGLERCGNESNQHPNFLNVDWKKEEMNFGVNVFRQGRFGEFEKMVVKDYAGIYGKKILQRIHDLWGIEVSCLSGIENENASAKKQNGGERNMIDKKLLDCIKLLRQDPVHREREHESLVENFYRLLGYKPTSDIKYRRGRIDVSIQKGDEVLIVNEVKRDWSLDKSCMDVISQAYHYAHEVGAPKVVITNGDYYAIFDRTRGLSYKEHFVGDFCLSHLQTKDKSFLNFLKKQCAENK